VSSSRKRGGIGIAGALLYKDAYGGFERDAVLLKYFILIEFP